jgi:hypothetical protein
MHDLTGKYEIISNNRLKTSNILLFELIIPDTFLQCLGTVSVLDPDSLVILAGKNAKFHANFMF